MGASKIFLRYAAGGSEQPAPAGEEPSPYEYLMKALASCKAKTMAGYANRKGWPFEGADIAVSYEKNSGIERFSCEIALQGPLDSAQRVRLVEIAGRCPVHRTMESDHCLIETREAGGPAPPPAPRGP